MTELGRLGAFTPAHKHNERPVRFGVLRSFNPVNGDVNGSDPLERQLSRCDFNPDHGVAVLLVASDACTRVNR